MKRILLAALVLLSAAFAAKPVDDKYSRSTFATMNLTSKEMVGRPCAQISSTKYTTLKGATEEIEAVYKLAGGNYSTRLMPNGMVYLTSFSEKEGKVGKYLLTFLFTDKVNGGFYASHCSG